MSINNKTIIDLLRDAKSKGMSVFMENGKLRYTIDKNKSPGNEFINNIKAYKNEITEFLSSQAGDFKLIKTSIEKITPRDRVTTDKLPLTFSQERLWFIDQLEGSIHYHIPAVLRLKGKLNIDALIYGLQNIVNRHEILRSVILEEEGKGYQIVKDKDCWQMQIEDGSQYKEDTEGLKDYIKKLIQYPFKLSEDHMMRGNLIRLDEEDHVLVLILHHIASDGWSVSVIVKEMIELYRSYEESHEADLMRLPVQYADFAIWQRNYLQGQVLEKKLDYWREKLKGVEPLQLPIDFQRPAVQSMNGASAVFKIDKDLSDQIHELSQKNGTTLFMTMLTAFDILLHRYSGQQDICVGSPIAGRQQEEVENLIGFFVNTLALRCEVSSDSSFTELLQQVRLTTLEAYEHQEAPFEQVVESVVNQRDMSRSPLFQVMFMLQNTPEAPELRLGELNFSNVEFENNISKFELLVEITDSVIGLQIGVEYCTDLFKEQTIIRMIDHFRELLRSIVADPHQKIGLLPMLSKSEEHQLLNVFNDTEVTYPKDKSITDLFEEQVTKTPEKIALVFEEQQLTYKELNERSNRLAHYLQNKGVKAGTLVPLCIERSLNMITGILGILKAGGAYVPVDPEYPAERVRYILEDTGASVMVSSKEVRLKLQFREDIDIIEIDGESSAINQEPVSNLLTKVDPFNLTYVLYTSGSTGKPKGVRMSGRGLVNLLMWQEKQFVNKQRNVLQFTSLNFDVSFQEIFSTLCFGSTLYLIKADRRIDMSEVLKDIAKYRITHLFIPYIVLKNLAEHISAQSGDAFSLEEIITAGEQLKLTKDIESLLNKGKVSLINQYGPTETHVVSSYRIDSGMDLPLLPPIGKPIDNTQIYILSNKNRLVPVGIQGELCIGGVQLAHGYLNLPDLTKEKFIKNPFNNDDESRIYKTGDLCRWLPDGNIEYLGRGDDQIKIRGYRVELGEIESVLQECELVRQAVVTAKLNTDGTRRLAGYVVPEEVFYKDAIVSYLKSRLPEYMVPSLWVELKSLPLTQNGKVDKRALPDPDASEGLSEQYAAPRTATEEKLASIWEELLGLERVGIHDNFFEIGGHSLLAMRVISSIRREMELELAVKELFLHPTISELAIHLEVQTKRSLLPAIEVLPRPERIPLSFSQERLWFIDRLEGSVQYHLPAVLRLKGKLNEDSLIFAMRNIVNRHEILRTVIKEEEGNGYQTIKDKDGWELEIVEGSHFKDNAQELQSYINELINAPFNLSQDYMMRGHLIKIEDQDNVLVVTQHHIASDGWSISVMVRELVELYRAYEEGRESKLLQLPVQYADFAIWQRNYLQGEVLEKKLGYWKEKLQGALPLELPTDYTRPAVQSTKGAVEGFVIEKELTESLLSLSQKNGTTLFMTLLSAFNILLYKYSSQQDICVGSPIAGRQQKETEELIGFFINTLVFRSEVNNHLKFTELLQQVRATTFEAYEHQDVPFEKIVDSVVKQRDMSRSPLFQVMLIMQNTPDVPGLELGDLQFSPEASGYASSKFDLTLSVTQTSAGLFGSLEYCTDLYREETIVRMISHFKELLNSIVSNPEQKIGELSILSPAEEHQLLYEFNDTDAYYETDKTVIDLFEEQASKTPGNTAVIFGEEQLTYKELNERSNQLANYLIFRGVKHETPVPICIEPGIDMIVGILGILKSGGAYVPVDPDYPPERISYCLADTGANIVITGNECKSKLNVTGDIDVITLDHDWKIINSQSSGKVSIDIQPQQLAYVIYTSGSTGIPKGVMIEHRNLLSYLTNLKTRYIDNNEESSGSFIHLSYTFDASVTGIFMPLLTGKSVVISSKKSFDVFEDDNLFKHAPYDFIKITPSHLELLHSKMKTPDNKTLTKKLVIGGEALHKSQLSYFSDEGLDIEIINEYGPTEATVGCSIFRYNTSEDINKIDDNVPIGTPIDNVKLFILGENNSLTPVGVAGELFIGGPGLARGYLNLPDLTREKFIKNPFGKEQGSRLYRTGDIARRLKDGNLEFLGRKDDQVKIRGYRVELGEIENVLLSNESVKQAVVLQKEDKAGNKRLIGYVTANEKFDKEEIISYLKGKLPEYMVPVLFVQMESFPLTSNGKIDKKALPDPDISDLITNEYVAPRNESEEKLAAVWQELLGLERVGIHDNFFMLGGHSLLAMRLIHLIRREFETELPIKEIFQNPTIAGLVLQIELQGKGSVLPDIKVLPRPEDIPLSFSQERLWFIDRLEGTVHYHVPSVLRLKGKLDIEALTYSFQSIVKRHEVVRTVIREKDGVGYQYIKNEDNWELEIINGSKYSKDNSSLQNYVKELVNAPFNLSEDYMMRAHLIRMSDDDHVLVVTVHHLASDGWSTSVMVRDLVELYKSREEGREPNLSQLKLQFADFAMWQRNYLQGEVLEKKLDYWKGKLEGVEPLQLPLDYVRPANQTTTGSVSGFIIDKSLTEALKTLSQKHGTTLFMTLLAIYNVMLSRYSSQQDICIGTPIVGRQQKELEDLIGCFFNTLALRNEVNSHNSFSELLQQVKTTTLEAYDHQDVPFEKIVESVVKQRDMSISPVFQVAFTLQNTPKVPEMSLGKVQLLTEPFGFTTSKFEITLGFIETSYGLSGSVEYNTDLYREETILRMITHFKELVNSVLKDPQQKIGSLPMLTKSEELQLTYEFNDTAEDYPKEKSLVDLFEEKVKETPDAVALEFEHKKLTYKELNERSNQLAHYLKSKGVKEETLVPIFVERSLQMLIGIWAVLKAGGTFVPVDTDYPEDRISFMIDDTNAGIILTSKESKSKLHTGDRHEIIEFDGDWIQDKKWSADNLHLEIKPSQLAYVIYTSGSTGKPKGVMIKHSSLINLVISIAGKVDFTSESSFLSVTTFSFDMCYLGFFMPFVAGGKLIIVSKDVAMDGFKLAGDIASYKPTHLQGTPSTWLLLLDTKWDNKEGLKFLIGGETVKEDIKEELTKIGDTYNLYGPTETTVWSTFKKLKPGEKVLIGKPIANTKVYVMNELQELCPVRVAGEICISGEGLARGYYNRPELTAEKFVINHLTGEMMFKTGDIGYWLPDGNLVCLDRRDFQVKIRGFRIELGEIESVLQQSDLVNQAVVLVKEDSQAGKRLVGYATAKGEFDRQAVISYLKNKLPDYMVPLIWVEMDSMPLTTSGKINRKALPDPDVSKLIENEYVAPENELERALVGIWQKLLNVSRVGTNDNFFELGGHSLLALRLFSDIEKLSGKKFAISILFNSPTIKQLAAIIKDEGWIPPWKSLVPIKPDGSKLPIYFVPPAAETALHFQTLVKYIPSDQPVYVLEPIGLDGEEQPHNDLIEMAAFYVKEILSIQPKGPYLIAGRCLGGRVVYEMAQQLRNSGHEVALLAILDTWPPFVAPPPSEMRPNRDTKHFISRTFYHLKKGTLLTVAKNFTMYVFLKTIGSILNKIEYIFSDREKRIYNEIRILHTAVQDRYIATKYEGKITLIECGHYNAENREKWKNLSGGGFETYLIPDTDHRTIMHEPYIKLFAEKLNYVLEKTHKEIEGKFQTNGAVNKSVLKEEAELVDF